jgi:glycosyltransferase involved in cell wall biosynthesis
MTPNPLVSIALCTYNGAMYLAEQLDTLVCQTYSPIEIIVVDDCSNDETITILKAYAEKYPQFKIYQNENNLGFIANFERAVTLCTGEFIALCDQDDLWHLRKIELQVNAIADNIFIYHDSEFIQEDGTLMNKKMSDLRNFYQGGDPEVFLFFNCVSGHSILMKKTLINEALPLKRNYFHDWWLAYVATNIGKINFIPQCLVQYRQHNKNNTNILQLEGNKDIYRSSSVQKIEHNLKWLGYCAEFDKNKNPALIKAIYNAYATRANSYISFKLSILLYKYRHTVFYIPKKSAISKINNIFNQIWGLKTKKLFQ